MKGTDGVAVEFIALISVGIEVVMATMLDDRRPPSIGPGSRSTCNLRRTSDRPGATAE
jgi:hypothetical protein